MVFTRRLFGCRGVGGPAARLFVAGFTFLLVFDAGGPAVPRKLDTGRIIDLARRQAAFQDTSLKDLSCIVVTTLTARSQGMEGREIPFAERVALVRWRKGRPVKLEVLHYYSRMEFILPDSLPLSPWAPERLMIGGFPFRLRWGDRELPTPLRGNEGDAYTYKLRSITQVDVEPEVYEVAVSARKKEIPYFEGTIWIEGGRFGVVKLKGVVRGRGPAGYRTMNAHYYFTSQQFAGRYWLCTSSKVEVRTAFLGLLGITVTATDRYLDYRINQGREPEAEFPGEMRRRGLQELAALRERLPVMDFPAGETRLPGEGITGLRLADKLAFFNTCDLVRHNRVEGFSLNPDVKIENLRGARITLGLSYAASLDRGGYSLDIGKADRGPGPGFALRAYRGVYRFRRRFYPVLWNSVSSYFGHEDLPDYYFRQGFSASVYLRRKGGDELYLSFRRERDEALGVADPPTFPWGWGSWRANIPVTAGELGVMSLGFSHSPPGWNSLARDWGVTAGLEAARPGKLGGDIRYTRFYLGLAKRLTPIGGRGELVLRGQAGSSRGELPVQRWFFYRDIDREFITHGPDMFGRGMYRFVAEFKERGEIYNFLPLSLPQKILLRDNLNLVFSVEWAEFTGGRWDPDADRLVAGDYAARRLTAGLGFELLMGTIRLDIFRRLDGSRHPWEWRVIVLPRR